MNKTTEALKLSEEALIKANHFHDYEDALAAVREALADHFGDATEMVMDWSKVKPEAINSDPMYQMGYAAGLLDSDSCAKALAEPVKQEPVAWQFFDDGKWHNGSEYNCHRQNTEEAGYQIRELYAAPVSAKREWVELTDDDINKCVYATFEDCPTSAERKLISAVIAAFKDKNK